MLIETTLSYCQETDILFYNLDEFSQTILLKNQANKLRNLCNIKEYSVIYDPLDASVIVDQLSNQTIGKSIGIDQSAEQVLELLKSKHANLLKSVPVSQLIFQLLIINGFALC